MTRLTDNDVMPFGKHKGKKMANVPASYLLWLNENSEYKFRTFHKPVFQYISDNYDVLIEQKERNDNR